MQPIHSKINVETKAPTAEDKTQLRAACKPKNRNNVQKNETIWERLSQAKVQKQCVVPDLNLKAVDHRNLHKKNRTRKDKNSVLENLPSARINEKNSARQRQLAIGNAYSKSNLQSGQLDSCGIKPSFIDEMKTSNSLTCISPRKDPKSHLADLENINPNQLVDTVGECNTLDEFFRTQFFDFESLSEYEYQTPKSSELFDVYSVESERSCGQSSGVLRHFKELLHQEESSQTNLLGPNEIVLLKNIVKADERHQELQRDDYNLLKEILMGQLKEVTQQERVIKLALKKIQSRNKSKAIVKVDTAEQPMESSSPNAISSRFSPGSCANKTNSVRSKSAKTPRQEVDVIFKNVPSLEKEIRILRSLGLKLEETLKKSSARIKTVPLALHFANVTYFRHCLGITSFTATLKATQCVTEIAQEFRICHQTIDELRFEKDFFIRADLDRFVLQRMNFDKLSRNPELLLKRMKPLVKGSEIKFNLIEQDPMFFNNFLTKMCKITSERRNNFISDNVDELKQKKFESEMLFVKSGAGDHPDVPFKEKKFEQKLKLLPDKTSTNLKINSFNSFAQKKKEKRCRTAFTEDERLTPKNSLLRIILIGTVQLSIFFTVMAAILYPNFDCI